MIQLADYQNFLSQKEAEKKYLQDRRDSIGGELSALQSQLSDLTEAQDIMNSVGILAQIEVKEVIESLVTKALQSIYGPEYSFEIENHIARNQPETYMYVVINGVRNMLKDELGGGVVDTVGFALRVILWALRSLRTDNVLVLDEPMRNLRDKDRLTQFGLLIREISELLGVQFIVVTNEELLKDIGDAVFEVEKIGNVSNVNRNEGTKMTIVSAPGTPTAEYYSSKG